MKVVSFGRNCEQYIENHMESLREQIYQDFQHIIVDDNSTDNTVRELMRHKGPNDIIHTNTTRKYWIENAKQFLKPDDAEIVVIVDLDDWLADDHALQLVSDKYEGNPDVWMTYSRMWYLGLRQSSHWIPTYNDDVLENRSFRNTIWSYTHLRTFKGFLWNALKDEDLRDLKGNYLKYAWDAAVCMPMLEMSAPDHIGFIPEILYVYNDQNPNQVEKNCRRDQELCAAYIRSKPKYPKLER